MKAWEREREIIQNSIPCYNADDNELIWEQQQSGPEEAEDALLRLHWHSQVPGSRAHESICTAAVQAMENRGYIVEGSEELLERGYELLQKDDIVALHGLTFDLLNRVYNAKKDESSPYWQQKFYDSFEQLAEAVKFPAKVEVAMDEDFVAKQYAGWLSQIIGGAYGTCIEGYTAKNIYAKYGVVDRYIRKPNTYNDDITYELALLLAYRDFGKKTTAEDIAREWIKRIPSGWSAEEWALRNLNVGIMPPLSGTFNNPFNEWIGAQMRGVILGQLYPGDVYMAAKAAFEDASISHARNGILGEVFNACMASMAFYLDDTREILKRAIELMPADSEYGQVVRFALKACMENDNYLDAWMLCEKRYERYNWIHAYPNACAEVIAMWFGDNDFDKTISICGGCGQDVDCNAAQVMTIVGIIKGVDNIREYWYAPFGDVLDTYCRGLKQISIKELAEMTAEVARSLR